jgi:septation ring formation regulator EzrA
MKHQLHFENATVSREAVRTRILIADLGRMVEIINSDIAAQEEQAQEFDHSQAEYPMLARTLTARREKLSRTIATLQRHLATIEKPLLESASA